MRKHRSGLKDAVCGRALNKYRPGQSPAVALNIRGYYCLARNIFIPFRKPGPLGQVKGHWLCLGRRSRNNGTMERWNNVKKAYPSCIPLFQYSSIPIGLTVFSADPTPMGCTKPGPLGQDIYDFFLTKR